MMPRRVPGTARARAGTGTGVTPAAGPAGPTLAELPGCATQGDTLEELLKNVREAVEGCLSVEVRDVPRSKTDRIVEITV